jgi:hypothetical protein
MLRARPTPYLAGMGLLWLFIPGCFEVQEVPTEPGGGARPLPLLIDDFEDGDFRPSASNVEPWRCSTLNPGPGLQPVACGPRAEGYASGRGYSLWFELRDVPDGVNDYPIAELFAPIPIPLDVRLYEEFRFGIRFAEGDIPLPIAAILQVNLHCDAMSDRAQSLDDAVSLPGVWTRVALRLANFTQPAWQYEQSEPVNEALCATQIDGLTFTITGFSDGEAATGTLMVDDVYLY